MDDQLTVENKIYAFLADNIVFDVKYIPSSFSVADSLFQNMNKPMLLAEVPVALDVRTGWAYSGGEFSNPDSLEEVELDETGARFAFVETETNKVFLAFHCEAGTSMANTYSAAVGQAIAIHDITDVEGVSVGSEYVNGNYADPA